MRTTPVERQVLETNSEYEQVALELQRRSEDYLELERLVGTPLTRAYPAEYIARLTAR